ncbi:hypothetical protein CLAVI_000903 [Candidatus Clavichlamydia salmonicola]|uniref:hypothetical protein n=1 Tax=Candidatus Clavichlamydia salmonicola TaxID=469812 RepID=UPI0018919260|nr:hypothetical protein [Candidatus Clavichlamydia salmonicola]MBF5051262.1 hypothetical protein [Candidatus Clavichlamydia salmonicola]
MSASINPLALKAILIEQEKHLLICPQHPKITQDSEHLQQHLQHLVTQIRQAALQGYSFNHVTLSSSLNTHRHSESCSFIQTITSFAQELSTWIKTQEFLLISSCGLSFYNHISESLNLNPPSFSAPALPLKAAPSSSMPINPKKRWRTQHALEESSSAPKKIKESSTEKVDYFVKELVMLEKNIFILSPIITHDLEEWFNITHENIGKILTNFDIVLLATKEDVKGLPFETLTNLRQFTLESLLKFLYEHNSLINQIPDPEIKRTASLSHLTLTKDLTDALQELSACIESRSSDSDLLEVSSPASEPKSLADKSIKKINKLRSIISSQEADSNEEWFVGIRVSETSFFLSSKKDIINCYEFKIFLKQIVQASSLSTYNSKQNIPNIEKSALHNFINVLTTLYHIVQRNKYLFNERHGVSHKLDESINSTLALLNQKYCEHLGEVANPSSHHLHLKGLLVSPSNPPGPIIKDACISYISIYSACANTNIIRIKKTVITTPVQASYKNVQLWLKSLKKHQERILLTIKNLHTTVTYLQCNDNSWPLYHPQDISVSPIKLIETMISISKYNYKSCTAAFQECSNPDTEANQFGHNQSKEILSSILQALEDALKDLLNNKTSQESTIFKPQVIEKIIPPSLSIPQVSFFSITRPDEGYHVGIHQIVSSRKYEALRSIFHHTKKTARYIKNILTQKCLPKIKHKETKIKNLSLFISLLYWGLDYNKAFLKSIHNKTYKKDHHKSENYYFSSLNCLTQSQEQLLQKLKQDSLQDFVTPLTSINQPIAQEILNLWKNIPSTNQTKPSNESN